MKGVLQKDAVVDELYTVKFFLKKGSYAESYRVKDREGATRFLKLFDLSKLKPGQFTAEGKIREIEHLKKLEHRNLIAYLDNGGLTINEDHYAWVVLEFIKGETLAEKLKRESQMNPLEAKELVKGVLNALDFLHGMRTPIIHNEITALNVMTDLSGRKQVPKLIDFGYSRDDNGDTSDYSREGLNQLYLAPECLEEGNYSTQSDIFSVGVLLYHLIFGVEPWSLDIAKHKGDPEKYETLLAEERANPLKFVSSGAVDQDTLAIIVKSLRTNPEDRFQTVEEFHKALEGEVKVQFDPAALEELKKAAPTNAFGGGAPPVATNVSGETREGNGFEDIAGMDDLKEMIKVDVIDALKEKDKYAEFGLTIPNGMLLYGPPGCGKTFFAEKFAEEVGFKFFQIKPSDLQSKYVNATQENIGALFNEARQSSPSIVFIDELDALVPDRNTPNMSHMNASPVNEFLAQMNNSGEAGVFVIGASNRPLAIDPAVMRSGRLDKVIYIPPPDQKARAIMFELLLSKRPIDGEINYTRIAELSENFMSSDIRFLCDEASRTALKTQQKITQAVMEDTIRSNKPSISQGELQNYERMREKLEGPANNSSGAIGFRRR